MELWFRRSMWLSLLFLIGCGASYQSGSERDIPITRHANSHFEQGNIDLKEQRYHEAIEHYRQALYSDPDNAIIHAALGWAYYNVGMLDAAIAEGEAVMRLEPDNPDVAKLMEMLYQERKQHR